MTTRQDIVAAAKNWVGVPYRHMGRNHYGVDCVGLIIKVAHDVGLTTYDTTNYPKRPKAADLLREMRNYLQQVPKGEAGPGDILVIAAPSSPVHMGVLEVDERGQSWLIHAYAPARKVVRESLGDRDVRMAFHYTGVED